LSLKVGKELPIHAA